ncbi:hypothetical protein CONLIGDRAFT_649427 [Coniochaeta ligniaria NRRL 30616]|uniref:Uncharacterized protein n=1 Tax=Coniochaeta ligniaria NRRL 30616 TaxID=1408157 RepID=A0A1J7J2K6_9PEZI|nr:hypothetical protein CONLIGDRAFT_649427 [Coniochaeta ligniaria NRRL 30616]
MSNSDSSIDINTMEIDENNSFNESNNEDNININESEVTIISSTTIRKDKGKAKETISSSSLSNPFEKAKNSNKNQPTILIDKENQPNFILKLPSAYIVVKGFITYKLAPIKFDEKRFCFANRFQTSNAASHYKKKHPNIANSYNEEKEDKKITLKTYKRTLAINNPSLLSDISFPSDSEDNISFSVLESQTT